MPKITRYRDTKGRFTTKQHAVKTEKATVYRDKKGRFTTKRITIYRDAKGRFTTKSKAIKTQRITVYRDSKGRFTTKSKAKKRGLAPEKVTTFINGYRLTVAISNIPFHSRSGNRNYISYRLTYFNRSLQKCREKLPYLKDEIIKRLEHRLHCSQDEFWFNSVPQHAIEQYKYPKNLEGQTVENNRG